MKKRIGMAALLLVGVLTALGPVVARNYVVGNEIVITTAQAGQNFYIGHNPDADGTYVRLPFVHPDPLYEQEDFKKEAEKRTGRKMSPPEVSRYWLLQGLDYMRSNPMADLQLTGKKMLLFLNNYEIPDNLNFYFHHRYSSILQILPVSFGLLVPFFLLGLVGMLSERRTAPTSLFFIQIVYMTSVLMFFVFSRYRMVTLPLFCLSAGYGFFMLQNQFRRARWRKFAASLILMGFGFGIAHYQVIKPYDFSHSFYDEGVAYEMKGDVNRAINSYEQALDINPDFLSVLERLGKLQLQDKKYEGARRTFNRILGLNPDSVDAKYQIMLLDKLGR